MNHDVLHVCPVIGKTEDVDEPRTISVVKTESVDNLSEFPFGPTQVPIVSGNVPSKRPPANPFSSFKTARLDIPGYPEACIVDQNPQETPMFGVTNPECCAPSNNFVMHSMFSTRRISQEKHEISLGRNTSGLATCSTRATSVVYERCVPVRRAATRYSSSIRIRKEVNSWLNSKTSVSQTSTESVSVTGIYRNVSQKRDIRTVYPSKPSQMRDTPATYPSKPSQMRDITAMCPSKPSQMRDTPTMCPSKPSQMRDTSTMYPSKPSQMRDTSTMYPSKPSQMRDTSTMYPSKPSQMRDTSTMYPSKPSQMRDTPTMCPSKPSQMRDTPTMYPSKPSQMRDTPTMCPSKPSQMRDTPTMYPSKPSQMRDTPTMCPSKPSQRTDTPTMYRYPSRLSQFGNICANNSVAAQKGTFPIPETITGSRLIQQEAVQKSTDLQTSVNKSQAVFPDTEIVGDITERQAWSRHPDYERLERFTDLETVSSKVKDSVEKHVDSETGDQPTLVNLTANRGELDSRCGQSKAGRLASEQTAARQAQRHVCRMILPETSTYTSPSHDTKGDDLQETSDKAELSSGLLWRYQNPVIGNLSRERIAQSSPGHPVSQAGKKSHHTCGICWKTFTRSANLRNHRVLHTGEKPYSCHVCHKTFSYPQNVERHLEKTHPGEKQYTCDICQESFVLRGALKQHYSIHTNNCDVSGENLSESSALIKHGKMLADEKPYRCNICQKRFKFPCILKHHALTHTAENDKGHYCHVCKREFTTGYGLNRHVLRHYGEKRYTCGICNKRFSDSNSYKQHQVVHTDNEPYTCKKCQKRFAYFCNLKKHRIICAFEKRMT